MLRRKKQSGKQAVRKTSVKQGRTGSYQKQKQGKKKKKQAAGQQGSLCNGIDETFQAHSGNGQGGQHVASRTRMLGTHLPQAGPAGAWKSQPATPGNTVSAVS